MLSRGGGGDDAVRGGPCSEGSNRKEEDLGNGAGNALAEPQGERGEASGVEKSPEKSVDCVCGVALLAVGVSYNAVAVIVVVVVVVMVGGM